MSSEEPTSMGLLAILWRHKVLIALTTAVACAIAIVFALTATPYYKAEAVIADAPQTNAGTGASALATELGGLAGVNLSSGNSEVRTWQAILNSRHLIEEFITRNGILSDLNRNTRGRQSLWWAVNRFQGQILTIRYDRVKDTTVVSIEWTDPATAAKWANGIVALTNELIRTRALDEARRNIAYLNAQLAQTRDVELRRVIDDIIEGETKKLMLANGRAEYAFETVDPAVAPEVRSKPKRTIIVAGGGALGFFIAALIVWAIERNRKPLGAETSRGARIGGLSET